MSDAVIFVGGVANVDEENVKIQGNVYVENQVIDFETGNVGLDTLAANINLAIRAAAIAECAAQDPAISIGGAGDKLTLFCGAMGL